MRVFVTGGMGFIGSYIVKALLDDGHQVTILACDPAKATHAWSAPFTLESVAPGAYLALAIHGEHGNELAYAGIRTPDGYLGAPRRAPSYHSNTWECPVRHTNGNTTYFFPLEPGLAGQPLEAVTLLLSGGNPEIRPELWLTAYPVPYASRRLTLER